MPGHSKVRRSKQETPDRTTLLIVLLLIAITLAVYWPVLGHEFTNYDDTDYVTSNPHVQSGLSWGNLVWAFNIGYANNWHPLTWISHMLDWRLFGQNPIGHHAGNLLFHLANTLLLFLVFRRMTSSTWKSAFVAALFAVHPLHVESVAWVAERKDVLSTLFWMLTMWAYVGYAKRQSVRAYISVIVLFVLGLMSKPMLVTLPLALLLLDYWPLGRFEPVSAKRQAWRGWTLLAEKVPLFVLSAASSILTYLAQQRGGALAGVEEFPIGVRVSTSLSAYVGYILDMFRPSGLVVFYPHEPLGALEVIGAAVVLVCVTVFAVMLRHRRYLLVGWLWYLGTLVPVIGLVQVGAQAMADRYTYVPLIGLFVMIAWGVPDLLRVGDAETRRRGDKVTRGVSAVAAIVIAMLMLVARIQAGYWHDSMTLFQRAVSVTPNSSLAHNNLGTALYKQGNKDEAMEQFTEALRLNPELSTAHNALGFILLEKGKTDEAIRHLNEGLSISPDSAEAHDTLGDALARKKRLGEAIVHFQRAIEIKPEYAPAHRHLAVALYLKGDYAGAWAEVRVCRRYRVRLEPGFLTALSAKLPEPID